MLFLVLCGLKTDIAAQEDRDRQSQTSLYFEGLGNAGLFSWNIDRTLAGNVALRVGFSKWSSIDFWGSGPEHFLLFPVMASYLLGKRNSSLEVGAGFVVGRVSYDSGSGGAGGHNITNLTGVLGYRYQRTRGGFLFRTGLTPMYSLNGAGNAYPDEGWFLSMGVSLGYTFRPGNPQQP